MNIAWKRWLHEFLRPQVFSFTDLPSENEGTVKRQIYADGFFPKVDILTGSTS